MLKLKERKSKTYRLNENSVKKFRVSLLFPYTVRLSRIDHPNINYFKEDPR